MTKFSSSDRRGMKKKGGVLLLGAVFTSFIINTMKVKFDYLNKSQIDPMYRFCFPDGGMDWSEYFLSCYPELKLEISKSSEKDKYNVFESYFSEFYNNNLENIKSKVLSFELEWRKYEKSFFKELSKLLGTKLPKGNKVAYAYISMNPICPRSIENWSFWLYYNFSLQKMIEVCAHETIHFFYFKKWQETFSDCDKKTFNHPHIVWHLSEILAPIILGDEKINHILKLDFIKEYDEYKKNTILGESITEYFRKIYMNWKLTNKDFGILLKIAYEEIIRYKKILERI